MFAIRSDAAFEAELKRDVQAEDRSASRGGERRPPRLRSGTSSACDLLDAGLEMVARGSPGAALSGEACEGRRVTCPRPMSAGGPRDAHARPAPRSPPISSPLHGSFYLRGVGRQWAIPNGFAGRYGVLGTAGPGVGCGQRT
jgi:hypothetical protein